MLVRQKCVINVSSIFSDLQTCSQTAWFCSIRAPNRCWRTYLILQSRRTTKDFINKKCKHGGFPWYQCHRTLLPSQEKTKVLHSHSHTYINKLKSAIYPFPPLITPLTKNIILDQWSMFLPLFPNIDVFNFLFVLVLCATSMTNFNTLTDNNASWILNSWLLWYSYPGEGTQNIRLH